jgi:hypothetical protein
MNTLALAEIITDTDWDGLSNLQCWSQDDHTYLSHVSTYLGDWGHKHYVDFHQTVVNKWRDLSQLQCDVDSSF